MKNKTTVTGTEKQTLDTLLSGFDDRFQKYVEEIRKIIKADDKILDIGCGEGKIWQLFQNCQVTGVDMSRENLRMARKYLIPIRADVEKKAAVPK